MKKIVVRFWMINLLLSIILFVAYRIVISQTKIIEDNSFEKWMQIFEVILNIGFSFVFLIVMAISSFIVLLNFKKEIRDNLFYSLLTFLSVPLISFFYIIITKLIHIQMLNFFSIIYIFITTMQFLFFRKLIKKYLAE